MFSQLRELFPWTEFKELVKRTHAERHARAPSQPASSSHW